ncbi:MAG: hypothetical protein WD079_04335 [Phycisphaeraceae bacterium]
MPTAAKWMVGYGFFLIACGLAAWAIAGFESRAVTAIIVGGATGTIAILMGILSAANNHKIMMVGIHLGMAIIGLFAILFAVVAGRRWPGALEGDVPMYLPITITIMALGSIVALIMVIRQRPAKKDRGT